MFEKNKLMGTVLFVSWLATYQWKKLLKTATLLVQELIKYEKVINFWPNFDSNFTDIWRA